MQCTSAEAAKLLRKLSEEKAALESQEAQSCTFRAAVNEDIGTARPEYDYAETQAKLAALDEKIRTVKHAVNTFNLTHEVPGFNMTIDMMLVYIPQLTKKRQKLSVMANRLAKIREVVRVAGVIEYTYANYDIEQAKKDYDAVTDELSRAQTALDVLNNSVKFEINI